MLNFCTLTSTTLYFTGNRPRPLAPGCFVGMICSDLTTLWCELTSSIRTRTHNDEDSELGIIDRNPKPVQKGEEEEEPVEKEILLCFRPVSRGKRVSEALRFPQPVTESSNANESSKSSSGSEGKDSSDQSFSKCDAKDAAVAVAAVSNREQNVKDSGTENMAM